MLASFFSASASLYSTKSDGPIGCSFPMSGDMEIVPRESKVPHHPCDNDTLPCDVVYGLLISPALLPPAGHATLGHTLANVRQDDGCAAAVVIVVEPSATVQCITAVIKWICSSFCFVRVRVCSCGFLCAALRDISLSVLVVVVSIADRDLENNIMDVQLSNSAAEIWLASQRAVPSWICILSLWIFVHISNQTIVVSGLLLFLPWSQRCSLFETFLDAHKNILIVVYLRSLLFLNAFADVLLKRIESVCKTD